MSQSSLALIIRVAREELDNALENLYGSEYYFYLKKPANYYKLLLYAIEKVEQLTKTKMSYHSIELRLKTEKYLYELISGFLPIIPIPKQPIEQPELIYK